MSEEKGNAALRQVPSVHKILSSKEGEKLSETYGKGLLTFAVRLRLNALREQIQNGKQVLPSEPEIYQEVEREILSLAVPTGRRAINAAGIILHTGLGRAPLSDAALEALSQCVRYTLLEVDIETGDRSKREEKAEKILKELSGAEAATVVNNCAAAIFLALSAVAAPGEVIISRSQLVEIGGSYRMPDVMQASGCQLKEIGTTNRTSIDDYRKAIGEKTSAILIVSQSNFRIKGFTHTPALEQICALGKEKNIPVLYDLGGGAFLPLERFGFSHEVMVQEAVQAGVDIVCFSGDKLIGGPQAGILLGKKRSIEKARKNSFFRMFRPDKMTLAALETSLLSFLKGTAESDIPIYQMACAPVALLESRAEQVLNSLKNFSACSLSVVSDMAFLGGGSLPDEALPSPALRIELKDKDERKRNRFANTLAKRLRLHQPSVFGRIESGGMLFNFRTVFEDEVLLLSDILQKILSEL